MRFKAIGFDIDGTLYPQRGMYLCGAVAFLKSPLLMYRYGKMRNRIRGQVDTFTPEEPEDPRYGFRRAEAAAMLSFAGLQLSGESIERTRDQIEKRIYATWEQSFRTIRPFDRVGELFLRLQEASIPTGLLSDFPVGRKPQYLGIEQYVQVAVGSEESGYLKPRPEPFRLLAERLGVRDLNEMLYVGNSYSKDIIGAHGAGMRTALITGKRKDRSRFEKADFVFHEYGQLIDYLGL